MVCKSFCVSFPDERPCSDCLGAGITEEVIAAVLEAEKVAEAEREALKRKKRSRGYANKTWPHAKVKDKYVPVRTDKPAGVVQSGIWNPTRVLIFRR